MLKILRYTFLVFFSILWLVGCSGDFAKFLFEKHLIADDYRFGDLYRLASLPQFRVPVEKCTAIKQETSEKVDLYIIGDSFSEEGRLAKEDFAVKNYQRFFIGDSIFLNPEKNNHKKILLIETVERHFRERFTKPYKNLILTNKPTFAKSETNSGKFSLLDYEFSYKTERHESALFSYDFFLKIKELKAQLNYYLLDKVDDKVALSKDKKVLIYSLDTKVGINSSFDKISDEEIEKLSKNVVLTSNYYKSLGFDEVILSIIPNKTSLYAQDLGEYNHLIERVQQQLTTPFIDSYTPLHSSPKMLYDIGDSHWNCEGKQLWIDKINEILSTKK